jgi:predicted  nucleic acid-binding Zn-ribbon protein
VASSHQTGIDRSTEQLTAEIDRLSLTQALRDFEVANQRVVDLTRRLLEANAQIRQLEEQIEGLSYRSLLLVRPAEAVKRSRLAPLLKRLRDRLRALKA